ncbi:hypothetical protein H4582DRAFT_1963157, partial [Lactarius indigo]
KSFNLAAARSAICLLLAEDVFWNIVVFAMLTLLSLMTEGSLLKPPETESRKRSQWRVRKMYYYVECNLSSTDTISCM